MVGEKNASRFFPHLERWIEGWIEGWTEPKLEMQNGVSLAEDSLHHSPPLVEDSPPRPSSPPQALRIGHGPVLRELGIDFSTH